MRHWIANGPKKAMEPSWKTEKNHRRGRGNTGSPPVPFPVIANRDSMQQHSDPEKEKWKLQSLNKRASGTKKRIFVDETVREVKWDEMSCTAHRHQSSSPLMMFADVLDCWIGIILISGHGKQSTRPAKQAHTRFAAITISHSPRCRSVQMIKMEESRPITNQDMLSRT
jgi:hypothetical protein